MIPDYQSIMLPLLEFISDGKEYKMRNVTDELALKFAVSEAEQKELLPSGVAPVFYNRTAWAKTYLKKAGLIESPKQGIVIISKRGLDVLKQKPNLINVKFLKQFSEFVDFQTSKREDGIENETSEENKNIIWKGVLQKNEIICELRECDYLVVPSSTEGLPFVILEAMNIGIPCIYSRIIGADELIGEEGERGFTFELRGYKDCKMKMDWSVFKEVDAHFEKNIENIIKCIKDAYKISITEWNKMSKKCINFVKKNYLENKTSKKNLKSLKIIL